MPHRCANPACRFDYFAMRAICADPDCLDGPRPGCGRWFHFPDNGMLWLCCYCAMEYELAAPGQIRIAPDAAAFIWRRQIDQAEASAAHEVG